MVSGKYRYYLMVINKVGFLIFGGTKNLCEGQRMSLNLDVGKLGVVMKSFKIMLQPCTIQFYLHIPVMYWCRFVMD